ncbi:MAG: 50S ribosomal protein L19 [Chlamydiae bacterium RIFCSPHIGHO2_12_FULL_44_59]|nr:MAG: 50S ribosomal protein L19 [Chlamydiae bacterium RIFCSPHIGHO2_01_FULL_44_39]OGN59088.1 MAG: 50S ribosomal protein L19 [Chlamydiae bacterium RIFCSPHIGHO2_02_FULL_45_9]OGN60286.1 MAG: 50S ribosomal protein L19 [Chlamydiae bacterium RIFCSPHIGHO2_12_FULL_44_59]OGN67061.1 MAG: 50S ribosomal protein L19 [Chlamydiae bacterium RIFCSPLOWO2_01_FULL_44_52]OGN67651.1 MAG: 50S ribosomal protein L19 [Chlamydiae bacterium RIFCSPLOWO2_02_FULL_45_22]OGN71354.1 MAG: 50S ribosomal protein L19 [Chlamydiae 
MSRSPKIIDIENSYLKKDVPVFQIGDTVRVNTRIKEGSKERLQAFTGIVIAKKGTGLSETFTIYRIAYGSCMDRVFLLHSPQIASVQVMRPGKVRRAKLHYLRGKSGKSAKVKEQYVAGQSALEEAPVEMAEVQEEQRPPTEG